jgi:hypothetical protein
MDLVQLRRRVKGPNYRAGLACAAAVFRWNAFPHQQPPFTVPSFALLVGIHRPLEIAHGAVPPDMYHVAFDRLSDSDVSVSGWTAVRALLRQPEGEPVRRHDSVFVIKA